METPQRFLSLKKMSSQMQRYAQRSQEARGESNSRSGLEAEFKLPGLGSESGPEAKAKAKSLGPSPGLDRGLRLRPALWTS